MSEALFQIGLAGSIGVGLVFVQAGLAKLRHRELVPGVVANYRLLPDVLIAPVAAVLPMAEIAIGAGLLAVVVPMAVLPAAALLIVFAAAMAVNILRGRSQIDCGCGRSQLRQPLGWSLVVRNLVLAALVLLRLIPDSSAPGAAEIALALVGGASLFVLFLLFNAITALAASPLSARMGGNRT